MHHKAKFTRIVIVLATVAFLFSTAPAQSAQDKHQQLRSALDSGDVTSALAQLRALQASNEQLCAANNYDYLFARLSEGRGDFASAAKHYQANIQRNSVLMPYSLWHFAQMGRATGDLLYERERLRMLLNLAPNGLLRDSAAMRLGQSFVESQDFRGAAVAFRQLSTS